MFPFYSFILFNHKIYNCKVTVTFSREKPKAMSKMSFKPAFSPERKCREVLPPAPLFSPARTPAQSRGGQGLISSWKQHLMGALTSCLPTTREPKEIKLERLSHTKLIQNGLVTGCNHLRNQKNLILDHICTRFLLSSLLCFSGFNKF